MARALFVAGAVAAALLAGVLALPLAVRQAEPTALQYLMEDERFTTLVELLQNNSLAQQLNQSVPSGFTLFAPTNEAFEQFTNLSSIAGNYTTAEVLRYHVLPFVWGSENLTQLCFINNDTATDLCELRGLTNVSVALATALADPELDDEGQRVKVLGNNTSETLESVNNATITEPDIAVRSGLIHIVDAVLIPPPNTSATLLEAEELQLASLPILGELASLLEEFEQNVTTWLDRPATVLFIPSVNATEENDNATCILEYLRTSQNATLLRELINMHIGSEAVYISDLLYGNLTNSTGEQTLPGVTPSQIANSTDLLNRNVTITTLAQTQVNVTAFLASGQAFVSGGGFNVSVNNNTQYFDVPTRNGVIQLVDGLLVPSNFTTVHNITC